MDGCVVDRIEYTGALGDIVHEVGGLKVGTGRASGSSSSGGNGGDQS
jgi:hypothetical protein